MVSSLSLSIVLEPTLLKLLESLQLQKNQLTTVSLTASEKGLRLSADHISIHQVHIYLSCGCFLSYKLSANESSVTFAFHQKILLEALKSLMVSKGKSQNVVNVEWHDNNDFFTLQANDDLFETRIKISTVLPPQISFCAISSREVSCHLICKGCFLGEALDEIISNRSCQSIELHFDPVASLMKVMSNFGRGIVETHHSLSSSEIDTFKCTTNICSTYTIMALRLFFELFPFSTNASLRISDTSLLSIQLMVELTKGIAYAEVNRLPEGKYRISFCSFSRAKMTKTPSDFLKSAVGNKVIVRLHSDTEYRGTLVCLDGYMNIVLEDAQEWREDKMIETFGDVFIRGNNGMNDIIKAATNR